MKLTFELDKLVLLLFCHGVRKNLFRHDFFPFPLMLMNCFCRYWKFQKERTYFDMIFPRFNEFLLIYFDMISKKGTHFDTVKFKKKRLNLYRHDIGKVSFYDGCSHFWMSCITIKLKWKWSVFLDFEAMKFHDWTFRFTKVPRRVCTYVIRTYRYIVSFFTFM